jgi:hypothetical protein
VAAIFTLLMTRNSISRNVDYLYGYDSHSKYHEDPSIYSDFTTTEINTDMCV